MAMESPSIASLGPKRVTLEEVSVIHEQMLALVELDKELDMEMMKLVPDPASWEKLWQSEYNEVLEKLEKNEDDFFEEEELQKEFASHEEMDEDELVERGKALLKKTENITTAMETQLSLLEKEKKLRSSRIEFFEKFVDVETKRNEILTQKAAMSARIKDLLEAELNSEEVLDREQEATRRLMISDMVKWWDCLLYNMSVELNQDMQDEEVGKWSELYLKWCLWTDLKAGDFHVEDYDESDAQTN